MRDRVPIFISRAFTCGPPGDSTAPLGPREARGGADRGLGGGDQRAERGQHARDLRREPLAALRRRDAAFVQCPGDSPQARQAFRPDLIDIRAQRLGSRLGLVSIPDAALGHAAELLTAILCGFGRFEFQHHKNGVDVSFPVSSELQAAIDAMPKTNHSTFLHTKAGNARSAKALGNDFREWCDKAKLPKHCSLHGLRKGCLRILAEAGCNILELQSRSGHLPLSELQKYIDAADTGRKPE